MRRLVTVFALMLIAVAARAEDAARAVPIDGKCPVAADERWSPQERFVWGRVCVGEIADFNAVPDYGVLSDSRKPERLPDNRVLTSKFIETILLSEPYRGALTRNGVRIAGARFDEVLDLERADIAHELWIDRSLLEQGANLQGLRGKRRITFDYSRLKGSLNLRQAEIEGDVSAREAELLETSLLSAKIQGGVTFANASFAGLADLSLARISGSVDFSSSQLSNDLQLLETELVGTFGMIRASVQNVNGVGFRVRGQSAFRGVKISGFLELSGLQSDGNLAIDDGAEVGSIHMANANVRGHIVLDQARILGDLEMRNIHVGANFGMEYAAANGNVRIADSSIDGFLSFAGTKVKGELDLPFLRVGQALSLSIGEFGKVSSVFARIGGVLDADGSKCASLTFNSAEISGGVWLGSDAAFAGPVRLVFSRVGELRLAGSTFHDQVDLSGAQIRGELLLGSPNRKPAVWSDNGKLILRNVNANAIQGSQDAWPHQLDLNGFVYRGLSGINSGDNDRMPDRPVEWFKVWLAKTDASPQPYLQLAGVLREAGRPDAADEILYTGRQRQLGKFDLPERVWLTALDWSVGYGYHIERALYWAAGFIGAGVIVLRVSGEGRRNSMPFGIAYSFDQLLPIVRLREMHYDIDLQGWARYYFYVHKIMGYLLASFLIIGISGLVK